MDVVSAFAIVVFSAAWYFHARTPTDEPLIRLFFGTLLVLGAGSGVLGVANRLLHQ
jgi:hypothetical protein